MLAFAAHAALPTSGNGRSLLPAPAAYLVPLSLAFDNMEGAHFTWCVRVFGTRVWGAAG